ncbi:hypothetical protein IAR50_007288 [Cryptococcus sp. DSM 104548]
MPPERAPAPSRPPTMHSLYSANESSWDTPRASFLFYNPPFTSQPNTPLYDDAPPVPPLPPALPAKDSPVQRAMRDSIPLSGYTGSPDRTDFLAHLPDEIRGGGVYKGDLDAKVLAELLSPRRPPSTKSSKSSKSKSSRRKTASTALDTPPPLPAKQSPTTPNTSVYASSIAHSDTSVTTETPVQPRTALRGRRETVSQAHMLNPSLASLVGVSQAQSSGQGLGAALANLPWAEPPPRLPTPLQTPITPSPLLPPPSPGVTPSYAFLASDPVSSHPSHLRRPSASSSAPRSRPGSRLGPLDVPMSPSVNGHTSGEAQRFSSWSVGSGMADTWEGEGVTPYVNVPAEYLDHPDGGDGWVDEVGESGAATQGSSRTHSAKPRFSLDPTSSSSGHTRSFSLSRSKSTRSTHSTRSYYNTRRASTSTLGHVFAKRWEVRKHVDLELERGMKSAPLDGGSASGAGGGGEGGREEEEWMDLGSLVGRAVVLEKMLRGGKRLSNQSKKGYRVSRFTTSTPTQHRPSLSLSSQAHSGRHHLDLPPPLPSKSSSTPRSSFAASGRSGKRSKRSSTAPSTTSTAKRLTLRNRLSKKLQRSKSREDTFTELGSSGEEEEEDPGMFPDQLDVGAGDRPPRPVSKGAWRMSRRLSRFAVGPGKDKFGVGTTPSQSGQGEGDKREREEKGQDRIGGKGVLVFPEELSPSPPATPAKDLYISSKSSNAKEGKALRIPHCLTPTSPTPLLSDMEKGLSPVMRDDDSGNTARGLVHGGPGDGAGENEGGEKYHQSPHIGHRSPSWRHRQSVLSTLSTGPAWQPVVTWREWAQGKKKFIVLGAVGAVVLVVVIAGVAGGLAGKGNGDGDGS